MPAQRAILQLFDDPKINQRIQTRLPLLFALAEAQVERGGRVGMEAGTLREKVLIALLMFKYGRDKVRIDISVSEPEVDAVVDGHCVSIKTVTISSPTNTPTFKVSWTVDSSSAQQFLQAYEPKCDILLATICKGCQGGLYVVPVEAQQDVLNNMKRSEYLKLPKQGTNPRGVELSRAAAKQVLAHPKTQLLPIEWRTTKTREELIERSLLQWIELWQQEEDEV